LSASAWATDGPRTAGSCSCHRHANVALFPDREVDLGRVEASDEIVVSRQPGPAGLVYAVEVKRAPAESGASSASPAQSG
jgi:hypothetical protein